MGMYQLDEIGKRVQVLRKKQEYVAIEVWAEGKKLVIINYYNTCKGLDLNELERKEGHGKNNEVWCREFYAHNTLWGSERIHDNGQVIEELSDEGNLVCLNDGSETRIDVSTGRESVLDLTLVSSGLATVCVWCVYWQGTL